jgi:nucleoid-associated protein YgaU
MAMRYDPYTDTWVHVPDSNNDGGGNGGSTPKTPKKESDKKAKTPDKPVSADKGNDHRGTGQDDKEEVEEKVRAFEYDLEGTAEILPLPNLQARHMINLQGIGSNFSGKYFVSTVTHTINRGGYSMQVDVLRSNFDWKIDPLKEIDSKPVPKPKPPKPAPTKPKQRTHTVKKGDTLWAISKRYYGNGAQYMKIVNANKSKIKDPHWIYPKQVFIIP